MSTCPALGAISRSSVHRVGKVDRAADADHSVIPCDGRRPGSVQRRVPGDRRLLDRMGKTRAVAAPRRTGGIWPLVRGAPRHHGREVVTDTVGSRGGIRWPRRTVPGRPVGLPGRCGTCCQSSTPAGLRHHRGRPPVAHCPTARIDGDSDPRSLEHGVAGAVSMVLQNIPGRPARRIYS